MKSKKIPKCDCISTDTMAGALKALGHPVRLRIVQELTRLHSCCCADMCECFSHSQSTISQHLSVLKDAGIVRFQKDGNKSCFSLNHDALKNIQAVLNLLCAQESVKAKYD